jgi:hypothetical protein
VSRLNFAPKINDIKVTDIKRGLGEFIPKPDKAASFAELKAALKKAGYTLASAEITVSGTLTRNDEGWWVVADPSGQRFALEGDISGASSGMRLEITGDWQTAGEGAKSREVIKIRSSRKVAEKTKAASSGELAHIQVSLGHTGNESGLLLAPIRTTSPGLAVYKGGAVMPRYSYTSAHLGTLKAEWHIARLAVSYTPTPRLQLEADIPYVRSAFTDGAQKGSGHGLGNITLWGKYRFFRALETWGDRQAALRVGFELPSSKKGAESETALPESAFIQEQLTPNTGGVAAHFDTSFSQAKGRIIYGANIEGIARSERDGFRLGHELRINTDLEYVLLPLKYRSPTKELFLIFETIYQHRSNGRIRGVTLPGTGSDEFYIAPALQYIPSSRLVVEASYQIPVVRNTGPHVLRIDKSLIVGVRYLY